MSFRDYLSKTTGTTTKEPTKKDGSFKSYLTQTEFKPIEKEVSPIKQVATKVIEGAKSGAFKPAPVEKRFVPTFEDRMNLDNTIKAQQPQQKLVPTFKDTLNKDKALAQLNRKNELLSNFVPESKNFKETGYKKMQDQINNTSFTGQAKQFAEENPDRPAILGDLIKPETVQRFVTSPKDEGKRAQLQALVGSASKLPVIGGSIVNPETEQLVRGSSETVAKIPEFIPKIGGSDVTAYDVGGASTEFGTMAVQYGLINNAIKSGVFGSKLASLGGLKGFAANQGIDLAVDTIVQSPKEVYQKIQNDESMDDFTKRWLGNRAVDVAFNLAIGGAGAGIGKIGSPSKEVTNLKNVINNIPEGEQIVLNKLKGMDITEAKKLADQLGLQFDDVRRAEFSFDSAKATDIPAEATTFRQSLNNLPDQAETAVKQSDNYIGKDVEIDGKTYNIVNKTKSGDGYIVSDSLGNETVLPEYFVQPTKKVDISTMDGTKTLSTTSEGNITEPRSLRQAIESDDFKVMASEIDTPLDDALSMTIEIPGIESTVKRTMDGQVERGFSRNVRTDGNMAPEVNSEFDVNPEWYSQLANDDVLNGALKRFEAGYENAIKDFDMNKLKFDPENVVLARMIANEAAARGDLATMRRVLSDTAETLTTAGQYSQAAKILRDSNDPATIADYFRRELKKLNDQGKKQFGTYNAEKNKGWKDVDLTDEELSMIAKMGADTTDAEKQAIFEQVFERISSRIPVTTMEKWDAWRRMAMLTNPKTHARNIIGNAVMGNVKKVSDKLAAGMEQFIPKDQRTKSFRVKDEFKNIATENWDANKDFLSEGSRWEIYGLRSPFADKRVFDSNILEKFNQFSKNTLNAEDIFFLKRHYINDLAGFMQARGLRQPTQEAMDYALRRAQEATFREANQLATAINKLKGGKGLGGKLVDAAIPFVKTPANILKTGVDYSPVGLVKSIFGLVGNAPPAVAIENLSKGLTGTGLALVGYYLEKNGLIRGDYKQGEAKTESLLQSGGRIPNSIVTPMGSYSIDWLQPAALPLFMGVAFSEGLKEQQAKADKKGEKVDYLDATFQAMVKGGDTVIDASMLSGIQDLFGGYGSTTEKFAQLPFDYLEQGIPTIFGQAARSVDPTKRQRDYSSIGSQVESNVKAKIPFASKSMPAKFDMFGNEQTYGSGITNAIQQFLSPGYIGKKTDDPLVNETIRLYDIVGKDFLPSINTKGFSCDGVRYDFNTEEQSAFQKTRGDIMRKEMAELITTNLYIQSSDVEKSELIEKIGDLAYDKAKEEYLKSIDVKVGD